MRLPRAALADDAQFASNCSTTPVAPSRIAGMGDSTGDGPRHGSAQAWGTAQAGRRPLTENRSQARRQNSAHKATLTTLWFGNVQTHWRERTIHNSYAACGIKSVALKGGYGFLNFENHNDAANFKSEYNGQLVHRNLQARSRDITWNLKWHYPEKKQERRLPTVQRPR